MNESIDKILELLDIDKSTLPPVDKIKSIADVYNLMSHSVIRDIYDLMQLEYYACDFETHILGNYLEEYESGKIKQVDLNNMARILLYKFDANVPYNALVEDIAEEYLKSHNLI